MLQSPDQEWRRLTDLYSEKYDEELWELAADYKNLTEMAKQVLRDEMKKRGLGDPTQPRPAQSINTQPDTQARAFTPAAPEPAPPVNPQELLRITQHYATLDDDDLRDLSDDYGNLTSAAQQALREEMQRRGMDDLVPETDDGYNATDEAEANPNFQAADLRAQNAPEQNEWWVRVAAMEDRQQARQRVMMLSDTGIDVRGQLDPFGMYVIEVAANQADDANAILAQPIPQKIIDESKIEVPDFVTPKCPRCKADDAVLESSGEVNHWHCDACGHEWDEALVEPGNA
ncbi:MAG TPA: hypothetical protein VKB38_09415 [Terracidiphilus sp.]|nr:hypothetical protein [Terracidiphilus sp.]